MICDGCKVEYGILLNIKNRNRISECEINGNTEIIKI